MTEAEFWEKVDKTGGPDACWPWMAGRYPRGYGKVRFSGRSQGAHRVALELAGQIALGPLEALHTCDNPPCCNPSHLVKGTQAENIADMDRKGRGNRVRLSGEANGHAHLTTAIVEEIKGLIGRLTYRQISQRFGVPVPTISHIRSGRTWAHIAGQTGVLTTCPRWPKSKTRSE